jgi:uncharacterized membrane protein YidH (DUF202 family)
MLALAVWLASVALANALDRNDRLAAAAIVLVGSIAAVVGFVVVVVRLLRNGP